MALFDVEGVDLSPNELMDRVVAGLNDLLPPEALVRPNLAGRVTFTIQVADEYAEIVEEAAKRQGVKLLRVADEEDEAF